MDSNEKIYNCIQIYLNLDVRGVPIQYLDNFAFYKCIKSNYNLFLSHNDDIDLIKETYAYYCKIIPGLYKWKEETIYIKETERNDQCLLLTELLHSKSITQGHSEIESWLSEGLPHYLSYLLCKEYNIEYKTSAFIIYFPIWKYLHKKYGFNLISRIIYTKDLNLTISILKNILQYYNNDILTLSTESIMEHLGL